MIKWYCCYDDDAQDIFEVEVEEIEGSSNFCKIKYLNSDYDYIESVNKNKLFEKYESAYKLMCSYVDDDIKRLKAIKKALKP